MSVKLMALYAQPDDPAAFDAHYRDVHTPLVQKVPGLLELRINRVKRKLAGDADLYLIAELIFADQASFEAAMASPENAAAGADLANFAAGKVTVLIATD